MPQFKITFKDTTTEVIEADETTELRGWILFKEGTSSTDRLNRLQVKTRIKGALVDRVDRIGDPS